MKMTDLRAKARAIFGNAIAEPMPNQPNGAKALQQRANARPIPTYKVGGVVKKNDGGLLKKPIRGKKISVPLEDEKLQTRRDFAKPLPKKQPKIVDFEPRQPKTGRAPANAPKPPEMTRGPDITVRGNPPTKPGREEAMMEARRAAGMPTKPGREEARMEAMRLRDRRSPEESDVLIATRRGQQMLEIQKRREMAEEAARRKKQEAADRLLGIRMKNGGKMPDLTGDGKVTRADVLKGRGVEGFQKGGKVQTSSDTARKLATEMGGMKKGGKAKDGLAVMIAIGKTKPIKEKATGEMYASKAAMKKHEAKETPAMQRAERKMKPVKKAIGGAMAPVADYGMKPPRIGMDKGEGRLPRISPKMGPIRGGPPRVGGMGDDARYVPGTPGGNSNDMVMVNRRGVYNVPNADSGISTGVYRGPYPDVGGDYSNVNLGDRRIPQDVAASILSGPRSYKKGGAPVKKAVGGAGKTRKGMAPIKKAVGGAVAPVADYGKKPPLLNDKGMGREFRKEPMKPTNTGPINPRRVIPKPPVAPEPVTRGPISHGRETPLQKPAPSPTQKGVQMPVKKAQGGAGKVRKGMMSPTGDIKRVVKPKKGLGGM